MKTESGGGSIKTWQKHGFFVYARLIGRGAARCAWRSAGSLC
jgi:hypothetical protein